MRLLRTTLLAVLFAGLAAACSPKTGPDVRVDGARAHQLVSAGATLLDVRTPQEYNGGHIEGALNIPVDDLDRHMSELPKDKPIVVHCQSGRRSARAVSMLQSAGFKEVYDLGGIGNW